MPLFSDCPDDELLGYGVPTEWLDDVKRANEDSLLTLADHLPAEAAEALLELATGGRPSAAIAQVAATGSETPSRATRKHPPMFFLRSVAQARPSNTQTHDGGSGLSQASRSLNRRSMPRGRSGPSSFTPSSAGGSNATTPALRGWAGSAGTGKTVVAIHRAAHLARSHPEARVLLATFSEPLARLLEARLRRLVSAEPRVSERIEVYALDALGKRLYEAQVRDCPLRHTCSDRTGVDGCGRCCRW